MEDLRGLVWSMVDETRCWMGWGTEGMLGQLDLMRALYLIVCLRALMRSLIVLDRYGDLGQRG